MQRRTLLLSLPALGVAACGGGSGDSVPDTVQFSADRTLYHIGERAQLSVRFTGGTARIEPDLGSVADGAIVTTPLLDGPRTYRLVVERAGQVAVTRELTLDVRYRDQWVGAGSFAVSQHTAVTAADGSVIVIGGDRGLQVLSDAVDRFDPLTRQFTRIGTLVAGGRAEHAATRLVDGRILVTGGQTALEIGPIAELVDPTTGAVGSAGRLNLPRQGHACTLLADGRVLLTGGTGRNSAEIWDVQTQRWRVLDSRMQHDRAGHSATLLIDGRVLIAGGSSLGQTYVFAELFDPANETFTPLSSGIQEVRSLHAAWRAADGSVLIVGGEHVAGSALVPLSTTWRFDAASARLVEAAPLAVARTLAPALLLPGDRALLVGGQTATDPATTRATSWHAVAGEQAVSLLPTARVWHTLNRLPDGRVLVLGGENGLGAFVPEALIYE